MNVQNQECSSQLNPAHISQIFLQKGPDFFFFPPTQTGMLKINQLQAFQDRFVRFQISWLTTNAPLQHEYIPGLQKQVR